MSDHMFLLGGADHLPLTIREILYRLVGAHGYEKIEQPSIVEPVELATDAA